MVKAKMNASKKNAKSKKLKKNAVVLCRDGSWFWTTQKQFWQWVREGVAIKSGDNPLTGSFVRENEEKMVVLANTVLNLSCPNHLREALSQRRFAQNGVCLVNGQKTTLSGLSY